MYSLVHFSKNNNHNISDISTAWYGSAKCFNVEIPWKNRHSGIGTQVVSRAL